MAYNRLLKEFPTALSLPYFKILMSINSPRIEIVQRSQHGLKAWRGFCYVRSLSILIDDDDDDEFSEYKIVLRLY